jgi:nuclear GTP-binding protein
LQDWNDGRIPYFTLPPKRNSEVAGSSQLVGTWGAAFDADQSATLAGLRSMGAGEGADAFFQTDTLGAAHVDLEAMQQVDEAGSSSSDEEQEGEAGELRGPGSEGNREKVVLCAQQGRALPSSMRKSGGAALQLACC